jgi:hypothetical protein
VAEQIGFLDTEGAVPPRGFAETLLDAVEPEGPILVSAPTARAIRTLLSDRFADLASRFERLLGRLVEIEPAMAPGANVVRDIDAPIAQTAGVSERLDLGIDPGPELMDDQGVGQAYRVLLDVTQPTISRRPFAWALVRYADRQTANLMQAVANEHIGERATRYRAI